MQGACNKVAYMPLLLLPFSSWFTTYISTSYHYYALSTIAYNYVGRHQSSHKSYQDLEEISLTGTCLWASCDSLEEQHWSSSLNLYNTILDLIDISRLQKDEL